MQVIELSSRKFNQYTNLLNLAVSTQSQGERKAAQDAADHLLSKYEQSWKNAGLIGIKEPPPPYYILQDYALELRVRGGNSRLIPTHKNPDINVIRQCMVYERLYGREPMTISDVARELKSLVATRRAKENRGHYTMKPPRISIRWNEEAA